MSIDMMYKYLETNNM